MHHGDAGAEVGSLYLYGLRVHGDIDEAHGEADCGTGKAKLERGCGQPGQRQGQTEQGRAEAQHCAAGVPVYEPCAQGKGHHARNSHREQDEADLGLVRSGLHGEGWHAGREHAIDESRPDEEVGAGRAGLGERGEFHGVSPSGRNCFSALPKVLSQDAGRSRKKLNIFNILIKHSPMFPVLQTEGRWLRTQSGDIGLME